MLKPNSIKGYSNRYRKNLALLEPLTAFPKGTDRNHEKTRKIVSVVKQKLPPLNSEKFRKKSLSPQRLMFSKNPIIKPIAEKSVDYENAIKEYLGIQTLSLNSSYEEIMPRKKNQVKPKANSTDMTIPFNELSVLDAEENEIKNSLRMLDKKKQNKKKSTPQLKAEVKEQKEDKEIKIIQESLNKINNLLSNIIKKPSKK